MPHFPITLYILLDGRKSDLIHHCIPTTLSRALVQNRAQQMVMFVECMPSLEMQNNLTKSTLNVHWKDWCWSSNTLATWCEELTHWKRPWCWARLKAGGEGDNRGWDDWTALLTQWTWVWANPKRWWRTGKPGKLQAMGLQRVRHNSVTEQQQQNNNNTEP